MNLRDCLAANSTGHASYESVSGSDGELICGEATGEILDDDVGDKECSLLRLLRARRVFLPPAMM